LRLIAPSFEGKTLGINQGVQKKGEEGSLRIREFERRESGVSVVEGSPSHQRAKARRNGADTTAKMAIARRRVTVLVRSAASSPGLAE
jgi:hypothetical protein